MIKTRIAPSPTGFMHVGTLRTALYDYLLAKKHGGNMILRIEDTDQKRFVEGSMEQLIRVLATCGIAYEEGPVLDQDGNLTQQGAHGPYIQSQRTELYRTRAKQLLEKGNAYYCFCSPDRLEEVRKRQTAMKQPTKYDRTCLLLPKEDVERRLSEGEKAVIRLKMPDGISIFDDAIRGSVTFNNAEIDDQVLLKSDGFPTYHLAVVVDDHLMEVTHVIRGEEWLSSTPKHIALYKMFGWEMPVFAHLPLILNKDRSKLSKRQGDVAVENYLNKGFLPEALVNFVALLGWNPRGDQEIYTMQELIDAFDLSKVNKGGAVFDLEKLTWMNGEYIRALSIDDLIARLKPFLTDTPKDELLRRIVTVEKERLTVLAELQGRLPMYTQTPAIDPTMLAWKKSTLEDAKVQLSAVADFLMNCDEQIFSSIENIEKSVKEYITEKSLQTGAVLWPLRVALSGAAQSPSPFELLWVLGREEGVKRVQGAVH
ncbi:glutamate--tRNA ligase [Candidatus Uhrbacteria bacterium]|nr:glutamate--tRNA ligase [Candidatus Uhrbacteria bacterium]